MRYTRPIERAAAFGLLVLFSLTTARAQDPPPAPVRVHFAAGRTVLVPLRADSKFFINRKYLIGQIPPELEGLIHTHRNVGQPCEVTIDVPAGATVYLLIDSDKGANVKQPGVRELKQKLADSGWARLADVQAVARTTIAPAIYEQTFVAPKQFAIAGAGSSGITVATKSLIMATLADLKGETKEAVPPVMEPANPDVQRDNTPVSGPTTDVSSPLATINTLEIYPTNSGTMLGKTSEAVLTVTRGSESNLTLFRFAMPVGNQRHLAGDEALRFIRLSYPNWFADVAEITLEDKSVEDDGDSIGAALGTLVLSVIEGFEIEPSAAITGDISANGKVRASRHVWAKIRGAAASKCAVVALPADNLDQLADSLVYHGIGAITEVQVVGISTLADAAAVMRTNRDARLVKAVALFGDIQQKLLDEAREPAKKPRPDYVHSQEAKDKLGEILQLAPNHLSAKLLLTVALDKQSKTLSPPASQYSTFLAVRAMLPVLPERPAANNKQQVTPALARQALAELKKVRVITHASMRPLVDAWSRFIDSWIAIQSTSGSKRAFETQRQSLMDEMARLGAEPDMIQKILKEGV